MDIVVGAFLLKISLEFKNRNYNAWKTFLGTFVTFAVSKDLLGAHCNSASGASLNFLYHYITRCMTLWLIPGAIVPWCRCCHHMMTWYIVPCFHRIVFALLTSPSCHKGRHGYIIVWYPAPSFRFSCFCLSRNVFALLVHGPCLQCAMFHSPWVRWHQEQTTVHGIMN